MFFAVFRDGGGRSQKIEVTKPVQQPSFITFDCVKNVSVWDIDWSLYFLLWTEYGIIRTVVHRKHLSV